MPLLGKGVNYKPHVLGSKFTTGEPQMKRHQQHPWVAPIDKPNSKTKKEYIPSHEREGFDESKIEVLPSYGDIQKPISQQFIINRDKT
jgi:hypothetical protein